ncbi:hypothetical protein CFP56_030893 [Quercus suber]|uniref:DUF2921 domain-containing protein n=1 Tax=Quercus suber TaxID=58331 RepID=A0AAW0JM94_QUESU
MLMGFPNPSTGMEFEFPGPNSTLIAEGAWDCPIRLSLRFPAVSSLRNWRSIVGEIWSKKDVNDLEYFGRIGFQSWERPFDPQNHRYEYTVLGSKVLGFYVFRTLICNVGKP